MTLEVNQILSLRFPFSFISSS